MSPTVLEVVFDRVAGQQAIAFRIYEGGGERKCRQPAHSLFAALLILLNLAGPGQPQTAICAEALVTKEVAERR